MKNEAIAGEGSGVAAPAAWRDALVLLDQDLRRRGAAENTRAVYGKDAGEFAAWAAHVRARARRRRLPVAAPLRREAGRARARAAHRRRASSPRCARSSACCVEHGVAAANPAELLAVAQAARSDSRARSSPPTSSPLLDRIPASTPLELRDRALFELAYACGLRAEELVNLDVGSLDFDAEQVRVEGKGGKTRFVPVGEHALAALRRWLERGRAALEAGAEASPRCSSPRAAGGSRPPTSAAACGPGRATPRPRARSTRTPCGTRSRPICSRAAPICGRSRRCSGTPRYRQPRSTLG